MPGRVGRPVGWRKDGSRSHRVMIRLSEDERGWLVSRVGDGETESDVLRALIDSARCAEAEALMRTIERLRAQEA